MRDDGCSFESPNNTSTSAQEKASIWSRAPGIPSWDQCFKCFYRCGIYSPPAEASGAGVKHGVNRVWTANLNFPDLPLLPLRARE